MQEVIALVVGFLVGWLVLSDAVLSILYGIPRALYHILRGTLKPQALLVYVRVLIVRSVLVSIVWLLSAPLGFRSFLLTPTFAVGIALAAVICERAAVSKHGRRSLDANFLSAIGPYRRSSWFDVDRKIIEAYSRTLESRDERVLAGESELPFPKERIQTALMNLKMIPALRQTKLVPDIDFCQTLLNTYVPDDEIEATTKLLNVWLAYIKLPNKPAGTALPPAVWMAAPERQRKAVLAATDIVLEGIKTVIKTRLKSVADQLNT